MALIDEVRTRYGAARLAQLTNPDTRGNNVTEDTVRLQTSCDDVEALVEIHAGVVFDVTKRTHIVSAVNAVIELLRRYSAKSGQERKDALDAAKAVIKDLGKITGRDRIMPETDHFQNVSDSTTVCRPAFDSKRFRGISPRRKC